jgi:8-oxo-dGTP pyrophosphatase MutT (NUDIX family)
MPTNGGTPLRYGSHSTDASSTAGVAELQTRLSARTRVRIPLANERHAAVLVPIVAAPDGLELLCFERTHTVLDHKGEICFPGGSIDPEDAGVVEAALREAHEELGIRRADVAVLGLLDDVQTMVSNYIITPVVGYIASPPDIFPQALEVARPISVPIAELLKRGAQRFEMRGTDGTMRCIYAYDTGNDRIWGATARIIHGMLAIWFGIDGGSA